MKVVAVFTTFCFLGLYIQGTLIKAVAPAAIVPDFIVVLLIFLALNYPTLSGLVGAFVLGLAADFASAVFLGPNAAGAILCFGLTVFISKKIYAENFVALGMLTVLGSLVKTGTVVLLLALYAHVNALAGVVSYMFIEALLTGIVAPPTIKLLYFAKRRVKTKL